MITEKFFKFVEDGNLTDLLKHASKFDLLDDRDNNNETYLHRCARSGTKENYGQMRAMVDYIATKAPQLMTVQNDAGETALIVACKLAKCLEVILHLVDLSDGVSVNIVNNAGLNALHQLIFSYKSGNPSTELSNDGALSVVHRLIAKGVDVDAETSHGFCPLYVVLDYNRSLCRQWTLDVAGALLENGARAWSSKKHILRYVDSVELTEQIVRLESNDINRTCTDRGWNPLHYVFINNNRGKVGIVKVMLQHGALIEEGTDPIMLALQCNVDFEIVDMLLQQRPGYDVNTRNSETCDTLLVSYSTCIEHVERLLKLGADATIVSDDRSPLLTAVKSHQVDVVKKLIDCGADPTCFLIHKDDKRDQEENKSLLDFISDYFIKCATSREEFDSWFQLYQFILNLPAFRDPLMSTNDVKAILMGSVANLYYLYLNYGDTEIIHSALRSIVDANNAVLRMQHEFSTTLLPWLVSTTMDLEPISYVIAMDSALNQAYFQPKKLQAYVVMMLELGFSVNNTPEHNVTALSSLLLCPRKVTSYRSTIDHLAQLFMEHDVNVGSMALSRNTQYFSELYSDDFAQYMVDICVPDAVILALHQENMDPEVFKSILNHWWGPKAALLIFHPVLQSFDDNEFYKVDLIVSEFLASHVGFSHGTDFLERLRNLIEPWMYGAVRYGQESGISARLGLHLTSVLHCNTTPLNLEETCKYQIRQALAQQASRPGTSLPELIKLLHLPPLLRKILSS